MVGFGVSFFKMFKWNGFSRWRIGLYTPGCS